MATEERSAPKGRVRIDRTNFIMNIGGSILMITMLMPMFNLSTDFNTLWVAGFLLVASVNFGLLIRSEIGCGAMLTAGVIHLLIWMLVERGLPKTPVVWAATILLDLAVVYMARYYYRIMSE